MKRNKWQIEIELIQDQRNALELHVRALNEQNRKLREALMDIAIRTKRIREDKAVVGVEAFYIADIARAALAALDAEIEKL